MANKKTITMFFDGTGNNGYNVLNNNITCIHKSYKLAYTNIFRLYANLKTKENINNKVIYIEGIGTKTGEKDNFIAKGKGENKFEKGYGALSKLKQSKFLFEEYIKTFKDEETELTINLFGYSRGAALARIFAKKINKYSGQFDNVTLKFNFIGLFDTVASFHNEKLPKIDLSLDEINAKTIFQIAACHESRFFFPLTSILTEERSKKEEKLGSKYVIINEYKNFVSENNTKYIELYAPGTHTNIGGGNKDLKDLNFNILNDSIKYVNDSVIWEGLFKAYSKKTVNYNFTNYGIKNLDRRLQFVNLFTMINAALKEGLVFDFKSTEGNPPSKFNQNISNLESEPKETKKALDVDNSEEVHADQEYISEDIIDIIFRDKHNLDTKFKDDTSLFNQYYGKIEKLNNGFNFYINDDLRILVNTQKKLYDDAYNRVESKIEKYTIDQELLNTLFNDYIHISSNTTINIDPEDILELDLIGLNKIIQYMHPRSSTKKWERNVIFN